MQRKNKGQSTKKHRTIRRPRLLYLAIFLLQVLQSYARRHWMYSKAWIEDYRMEVKYGLPAQSAPTEYSMETHKIGVIQREDAMGYFQGCGYDYRDSSTAHALPRVSAIRINDNRYEGQLISDWITVPKNVTHELPDLRVDIVLLEKVSEETTNFIGLLEPPINDGYSSFSTSLRVKRENISVSYEFVLCGNYRRSDMLSIGYMHVRYNDEAAAAAFDRSSVIQDATVIDPYLFMVVVKSLTVNGTSLGTCEELNVRGAIFDNKAPGIYLPLALYRKFMGVILAYADTYDFPTQMRIWEKGGHTCYEGPVHWNNIPDFTIGFFANEHEAFQVSYSGENLIQRYYTKNSRGPTFCYIFAIRKTEDKRLILGRTAFEGIRLIFNRSGQVVSFVENSCCGHKIKLRKATNTQEKMSTCLPENLRRTVLAFETLWIWIFALATVVAISACIFAARRPMNRGDSSPPISHIFIARPAVMPCEFDRSQQQKNTDTIE